MLIGFQQQRTMVGVTVCKDVMSNLQLGSFKVGYLG